MDEPDDCKICDNPSDEDIIGNENDVYHHSIPNSEILVLLI